MSDWVERRRGERGRADTYVAVGDVRVVDAAEAALEHAILVRHVHVLETKRAGLGQRASEQG